MVGWWCPVEAILVVGGIAVGSGSLSFGLLVVVFKVSPLEFWSLRLESTPPTVPLIIPAIATIPMTTTIQMCVFEGRIALVQGCLRLAMSLVALCLEVEKNRVLLPDNRTQLADLGQIQVIADHWPPGYYSLANLLNSSSLLTAWILGVMAIHIRWGSGEKQNRERTSKCANALGTFLFYFREFSATLILQYRSSALRGVLRVNYDRTDYSWIWNNARKNH